MKDIILSNADLFPADNGGDLPVGEIHAANASRFNDTHLSQPLTDYATGIKLDEGLQGLLDFIAPGVQTARRFEFRKGEDSDYFLSETDDERAIGSAFKRVEYSGSIVNSKTLNKGLTIRVDHDDEVGDDWQERTVNMLMQRLLRNDVRRAATALIGIDSGSNKNWGSSGTTAPDADILSILDGGGDAKGIDPNRVLFGKTAWQRRLNKLMTTNTPSAGVQAQMTPEQLAAMLGIDAVRVSNQRYQSTASAKAKVVTADVVVAFHGAAVLDKNDPSTLKRFWSPCAPGGEFAAYVVEHPKFTDITVEHYSNIVATSTAGVKRLNITLS